MSTTYQWATGRAGNATLAASVLQITSWEAKLSTAMSDSTSSANYDSVNNRLWVSQEPGASKVEGTVEGNWDFATGASTAPVVNAVLSGTPVALVLKFDQTHTWCSGNFSFSDVSITCEVKEDTPVFSFSASIASYGIVSMLPSGS